MGMKRYEHATETPVRFCTAIEPRPPLPYLAEPCGWLGCSNRRSSVLRGSEQSALAAKTDNANNSSRSRSVHVLLPERPSFGRTCPPRTLQSAVGQPLPAAL